MWNPQSCCTSSPPLRIPLKRSCYTFIHCFSSIYGSNISLAHVGTSTTEYSVWAAEDEKATCHFILCILDIFRLAILTLFLSFCAEYFFCLLLTSFSSVRSTPLPLKEHTQFNETHQPNDAHKSRGYFFFFFSGLVQEIESSICDYPPSVSGWVSGGRRFSGALKFSLFDQIFFYFFHWEVSGVSVKPSHLKRVCITPWG